MKKIITDLGVYGPFNDILVLSDRYVCDGSHFPFSVIGQGTISDVVDGDFPTVVTPVEVPQYIQKWQAELILHDMGMLQSIKAVIDADPAMSIVYQGVTTFERTNGLITQVATLQDISDDVIDKMFIAASRYTAEMATDQSAREAIMREVGLI